MIPDTYRILKPHICAQCGSHFMSGHPDAKYCTFKCQRRAAHLRRKGREMTVPVDDRFYMTIKDPSVAQLDKAATDILLEDNKDKPILLIGNVPRWNPPKGVMIHETQDDRNAFIMDKHVPDIMEVFKQMKGPNDTV